MNQPEAQATQLLRQALREGSAQDYQRAFEELGRLKQLETDLGRRRELLTQLASTAPAWSSAIENRVPEHSGSEAPGEPTTFGAVSLVGDRQALKIDTILRQRLSPLEYRRRQILCGDAAQFQGDERDVMLLSIVDSPPPRPPLSMRQEGPKKIFKKRFNVAASRARNQMWIVHSLNHESDLQVGDYRRRLIEHSLDPQAWERELQQRLAKVDPRSKAFEGTVLRRLMERGYHVLPQFQAGAFYIDLVVIGGGRRLAIECDGEQFHGLDQLQNDLARQAVLERLGWTFVRIRGSVFFRDEERALAPVFARLEELGIPPELKTGVGASAESRNEVVERVIREAEKLRATWRTEPSADMPDDESDSDRRWRARGTSWTPPAGSAGETEPSPSPLTPTKQVLLNLVGSGTSANAATGTSKPLGRFENEILSSLRGRGRLETEPFVMELMKKLSLGSVERRQVQAAIDALEARGAIRCGANYIVAV